jgi:hypothetical protein
MNSEQASGEAIIQVNIPAVVAKIEAMISTVAKFGAYGLLAIEACPDVEVHMPGALMELQPKHTGSQLSKGFAHWLCGVALREYVTQIGGFLEEMALILSLVRRTANPSAGWDSEAEWRRFNKMNFPDKLDCIENGLGRKMPVELRRDLEGVNRARNCYEHRRGFVTERDSSGSVLTVTWRMMDLIEQRTDGTEVNIDQLPYTTAEGSSVVGRVCERIRSFPVGTSVMFTGPEIWEIGICLIAGAKLLVKLVERSAAQVATRIVAAPLEDPTPQGPASATEFKSSAFQLELYSETTGQR